MYTNVERCKAEFNYCKLLRVENNSGKNFDNGNF